MEKRRKKRAKNEDFAASMSVTEAGIKLGVTTQSVRNWIGSGDLESFQTPGGQVRIFSESIESLISRQHVPAKGQAKPSSVLQAKREEVEELSLEVQKQRTKRELEKLERETREEEEERQEAKKAEQEAEERKREELRAERAREAAQRASDREREKKQQALISFRSRWYSKATQALSAYQWLSPGHRKEFVDVLEAEVKKRDLEDEPRMPEIIALAVEAIIQPLRAARELEEARQSFRKRMLEDLPADATDEERTAVRVAILQAEAELLTFADAYKFQATVRDAVERVRKAAQQRREERQAEDLRKLRRDLQLPNLIHKALLEVPEYWLKLRQRGEISREDFKDTEYLDKLRKIVRAKLEVDLTGDEDDQRIKELVAEIIEGEFDQEGDE